MTPEKVREVLEARIKQYNLINTKVDNWNFPRVDEECVEALTKAIEALKAVEQAKKGEREV